MDGVRILDSPIKSPVDKKEYRIIQLQNGLTALLISDLAKLNGTIPSNDIDPIADNSDCESDEELENGDVMDDDEGRGGNDSEGDDDQQKTRYLSAASLCVGVGSFEDLGVVEGMMHFLEHMVFMGSEKYPKENCFDNYIKKCGGNDNAHTDYEHTTFYFDVQEKQFAKALNIFAQFFISPLMKVDAMQRERKAVHSEFQGSMTDDDCRRQQIISSMASENHPMSVFAWGNESTLQLQIPDTELHKKLHDIRNRLYSAQYMTLSIQARDSLDNLQNLVVDIFSKVPNNNLPKPTYDHFGSPFAGKEFTRLYKVVPINDKHTVDINWALPSLQKHYKSKPLHYLGFLIGHEGLGSIISYFKSRVWAVDIYSGNDESGFEHNSTYAVFNIRVHLTDEGFLHIKEIIRVIFQYLLLLETEGPDQRLFSEIQKMEKIDFDYAEEKNTSDNVEELSEAMQLYPAQHVLTGSTVIYEYDPELIKECQSMLKPRNCNIILSSKKFDDCNSEMIHEKWYGTKYAVEDIPEDWIKDWENAKPIPEFYLPSPNDFIPDDFHVLSSPASGPETPPSYPEKIIQDGRGELWFKQDSKFGLPRAYCYIYFFLDQIRLSAKMGAQMDLFLNLFNQHIMEVLYPANMAQYESSISSSELGFTIKINGFNQKLFKCVETILSQIDDFEKRLDDQKFYEMKQQQIKSYHNAALDPDVLRRDTRLTMLQDVHWQVVEKMKAMLEITKESFFREFVHGVLMKNYVKVLIQGNMTSQESKKVYKFVTERFSHSESDIKCPQMRVRKCTKGEWVARMESLNAASPNSSVVNYYQGEPLTLRTELLNEFVIMAMDEPVFDFLRTKDQLGYSVYCTNRNTYGVLGISVTVNSHANKHSVSYVNERIEAFLNVFSENLINMNDEEMDGLRETLRSFKLNIDLTLKEEVDRNWSEIVSGDYMFDRFALQLPLISTITSKEAASYLQNLVSASDNPSYRKLSVQVKGASLPEEGIIPCHEDTLKKPLDKIINCLSASEDDVKSGFADNQFIRSPRDFSAQMDYFSMDQQSRTVLSN